MMRRQNLSDEDLDKLLNNLSGSARTPADKYSASQSYEKLHQRISFPEKKRELNWFRYSAVASVLLIVGLSVFVLRGLKQPEMLVISTAGEVKEIILPDGSQVTLSRYSKLEYPAKFTASTREVSLSGEAYFDVAKNREHPFVVTAHDVHVKVLGTQFNIQSYVNDANVKTTLIEGAVAVSNTRNNNVVQLNPNQSAIFNKKSAQLLQQDNIYARDEMAWRDGILIFNNTPLSEIVGTLSGYFNVHIEVAGDKLKNYKLTARFANNETVDEILSLLQDAGNFTYSRNQDKVIIKSRQ